MPRILVYDDDADQRAVLSIMLEDLGFQPQVAGNHLEFSRLLVSSPDFVVLDLMLVGPDATDLLDTLAEQSWQSSVIFVSSQPNRILRSIAALAKMRGLRVAGFIHKPIQLDDLDRFLKRACTESPISAKSLRHMLSQGQFGLHYAPEIDTTAGKVTRLVARPFLHAAGSPPVEGNEVVQLMRAAGMAREYFDTKVETLLKDIGYFHSQGLRMPVAVHLGYEVLMDSGFCDHLEKQCRSRGILLSEIAIGIDECDLLEMNVEVLSHLIKLSLHGCDVILDGVETRVSYAELERIPQSEIRIASSLVRRASEHIDARQTILDLMEFAQNLGSTLSASDVETIDQVGWLTDLGIKRFQGKVVVDFRPANAICQWLTYGPKSLAERGMTISPVRIGEAG